MTYVLDTTVMSALMRADAGPSKRLLQATPAQIAIPQPVIAEVHYGLARLEPSRRRTDMEERLTLLLRTLPGIPWSDEVSRRFGEIKAGLERRGERVDDFDVAIAAHALAADAVVVTRNVRHFARIHELRVEDWA